MHLTLFFTRGNSLAKWHSIGSLERETALYKRLQARGIQVSFLTYGKAGEESYAKSLPGIEILYNRWKLPLPIYEILIPWLHSSSLRHSDVYKTNQIKGAHAALFAGWLWRKPTIIRQGYIWSEFVFREKSPIKGKFAFSYENYLLKKARHIIVTTQNMQKEILHRLPIEEGHITIIPNYVDTNLFSPSLYPKSSSPQLIFVGRLSEQKNLESLVEAVSTLNATLKIIGSGPLEESLKKQASKTGAQVVFTGSVPNNKLPCELNQASIFILTSFYEGHPKALLEAMSCGLAVIGTDVDGIRDLIKNGETGWLCQTDPLSIRAAIEHLLAHPDLRQKLGQNARAFVLENFSLDKIVEKEYELLTNL